MISPSNSIDLGSLPLRSMRPPPPLLPGAAAAKGSGASAAAATPLPAMNRRRRPAPSAANATASSSNSAAANAGPSTGGSSNLRTASQMESLSKFASRVRVDDMYDPSSAIGGGVNSTVPRKALVDETRFVSRTKPIVPPSKVYSIPVP